MSDSDVEPMGPVANIVFGLIALAGAFWMYTVFAKYEASGGNFSMPRIAAIFYSLVGKWGIVGFVGLIGVGSLWSGFQKWRNPQ